MKRLSIKLRITLWYTALMLLLVVLMMGFMAAVGGTVAQQDARSLLLHAVEENQNEVEDEDGYAEVDGDFAAFRQGVYSVVFDENGQLVYGQLPERFTQSPAFAAGQVQTLQGSEAYLVYDLPVPTEHGESRFWIRGYIPAAGVGGMAALITRTALFTLPLVVLLAALGGYFITKRAFLPIQKMNRAAQAIGGGDDLSQRIELGEGHDEVHQLASTINGMFERLQNSFEEEKRFVADASHELRTPTSVILAQCEYAQGLEENPEEMRESLTVIHRQAGRMARLISQLLAFSRHDSGRETLHPEETDLSELFGLLAEDLRAASPHSIRLHTQFPEGLFASVDRVMMTRLFENLVQNAYQYGKEGGNIWVSLGQEEQNIVLRVQDDGQGIPPEHLPQIWRRFYRADSARSSGGHSGLGLPMVQQIAQLHHGQATAQSTFGQGSLFTVRFPKTQPPAPSV